MMINQNRFYEKKIMLYDAVNKNIEKKKLFFFWLYIINILKINIFYSF